jgi:UDP-N-acetylglucosamine--N-acetylmuramyl-(pentapeptide) pyrophosphoryl-undecaprenol N-acetylglucosamine transferase
LTGGGSGGHITPILAVAAELKKIQPDIQIFYIGQSGDQLSDVPAGSPYIDQVYAVRAGKFRRYHGEGIKQIFDVMTLLKNVRDAWRVLIGTVQSYRLLGKIKPDCIFIKGGFVGVPVGLAAAKRHIPYITHDSDAIPGLANRSIARWAKLHAVGQPKELYKYPQDKTVMVGVPLQDTFRAVDLHQKMVFRQQLKIDENAKLIFITGGGNGALSLNKFVLAIIPSLLGIYPSLRVVHITGRLHEELISKMYDELLPNDVRGRVLVRGYIIDLYVYSGASDVIITRAGATNLAEFALQQKACIVIPNPKLTGGHQLINAEYLANQRAVICLTENTLEHDPQVLQKSIRSLLDNPSNGLEMGKRLAALAKPDAAHALAVLLLNEIKKNTSI